MHHTNACPTLEIYEPVTRRAPWLCRGDLHHSAPRAVVMSRALPAGAALVHRGAVRVPLRGRAQVLPGRAARAAGARGPRGPRARPGRAPAQQQASAAPSPVRAGRQVHHTSTHIYCYVMLRINQPEIVARRFNH